MRKVYLITTIILAIAAVIFALFVKFSATNQTNNGNLNIPPQEGIVVFSLEENEVVTSPLKITGYINGDGWTGFEGQVGTVKLLDQNGKELASTYLKAITEWTKLPTSFESNLEFKIPDTESGQLVFHNENVPGDPARDKTFIVSIKFK